ATIMVKSYLAHEKVISKRFEQTALQASALPQASSESTVGYDILESPSLGFVRSITATRMVWQRKRKLGTDSERKKIQRLKSPQTFNMYRTMESPAPNGPKNCSAVALALNPATTHGPPPAPPRHRVRYSFKKRTRLKQHEPPEKMKQYAWKAWKIKPNDSLDSNADAPINNNNKQDGSQKSNEKQNKNPKKKSNKKPSKKSSEKPNKKRKTEPKPLDEMIKSELVNELEREHPFVTLNMGTLAANART
ncbi:hypothetical protein BGX28_001504, partial [Mortierella sp. GBA30]